MTMQIAGLSIHPLRIVFPVLNFVSGLISVAACVYGVWFVLSDWSHTTFTRFVVLFFCIWLGSMAIAMTVFRINLWRRVLFRGS
jgi:hypothetical protein